MLGIIVAESVWNKFVNAAVGTVLTNLDGAVVAVPRRVGVGGVEFGGVDNEGGYNGAGVGRSMGDDSDMGDRGRTDAIVTLGLTTAGCCFDTKDDKGWLLETEDDTRVW